MIHMERARMEISERAHKYRNEAQRARAFVGNASMPRERELLLEISKEFERLAMLCESRDFRHGTTMPQRGRNSGAVPVKSSGAANVA
jgi:hypothetical protein